MYITIARCLKSAISINVIKKKGSNKYFGEITFDVGVVWLCLTGVYNNRNKQTNNICIKKIKNKVTPFVVLVLSSCIYVYYMYYSIYYINVHNSVSVSLLLQSDKWRATRPSRVVIVHSPKLSQPSHTLVPSTDIRIFIE